MFLFYCTDVLDWQRTEASNSGQNSLKLTYSSIDFYPMFTAPRQYIPPDRCDQMFYPYFCVKLPNMGGV